MESGNLPPLQKKNGINRSTCYDLLRKMVHAGFISETQRKGHKHFEAKAPHHLLQCFKDKYEQFESILPLLETINNQFTIKPMIRVAEGVENVKHAYSAMPDSSTPIKVMMRYEVCNQDFLTRRDEYFVPKRVANDIHISVISYNTPCSQSYKEQDATNKRETRFLPGAHKETMCGWFLYDNTCLIVLYDNNDLAAITIENKAVYVLGETLFDQLRAFL